MSKSVCINMGMIYQMITDAELDIAKFIVEQHSNNIKPGEIHENNLTVINWVNNAKMRIKNGN